ncbi:MAG: 4-hydroxy-tetrahydrodipicolinate synthase [Verrucomicrobia bacterium]|nr:4-hydroxy-tetrahydrodipicolinate synthase [Verrucomicrobiota bacterium]
MFTGTYTAIVTPFRNGEVDETAFRNLVEFQIENGVDGIVPTGTTGEAATLDFDEHLRVIQIAVEEARGRCKIIAGTGSNSTLEAIELTQKAEQLGVEAALLASPYYNKPTQEGVYRHYKQIAESTSLQLMLYNVPSRTGGEIGVETCARLAEECKTIVSIKEAGGSPERVSALKKILPPEFTILSGDDGLTLPFMAVGAVGVVSVASNVIPKHITDMVNAFLADRSADALKIHLRYYQLFKDLFIESNPIPVKTALYLMGMIENEFRLPLCEISKAHQGKLHETLTALKLI